MPSQKKKKPWKLVIVDDSEIKKQIAENEILKEEGRRLKEGHRTHTTPGPADNYEGRRRKI